MTRRRALALFAAWGLTFPTRAAYGQESKPRAKGAAELDLEYYIKDIFTGNALDPALGRPSAASKPARQLARPLVTGLSDITLRQIAAFSDGASTVEDVERRARTLAQRVGPAFQKKAPFPSDDATNQYRFDMMAYCTFKVAAELIPSPPKRAALLRAIGADAYALLASSIAAARKHAPPVYNAAQPGARLGPALSGVQAIMDEFRSAGFVKAYTLDTEDFEEEDWDGESTVTLQLDAFDPATLGSFTQASSEGVRFHADYVSSAVAAYLRRCGVRAQYEEYPLDSVYRPNPNEFVATEVLTQWTLSPLR